MDQDDRASQITADSLHCLGIGFGQYGEGYIRFSITQLTDRIEAAVAKLEKMKTFRSIR